jgi:hypothetical protein
LTYTFESFAKAMKRIYALRIATQDRPKSFQFIVTMLFYSALFIVGLSAVATLKQQTKSSSIQRNRTPSSAAHITSVSGTGLASSLQNLKFNTLTPASLVKTQ